LPFHRRALRCGGTARNFKGIAALRAMLNRLALGVSLVRTNE